MSHEKAFAAVVKIIQKSLNGLTVPLLKMFPPSLHKNIRELDKQITLLESECENMETEERNRITNGKIYFSRSREPLKRGIYREHVERPFVTGPRIPDTKKNKVLSVTKTCPKSLANSSKKISMTRETRTTSDESKCNKKYVHGCPICGRTRERSEQGSKDKKTQGVVKCVCGKDLLKECNQNLGVCQSDKPDESDNERQVLHKGILHANPGGTIEVTVTQKSSKTPCNTNQIKPVSSVKIVERNKSESCITRDNPVEKPKRSPRGQKWSEILCQENVSHSDKGARSSKVKINGVKSNYSPNSHFDCHSGREPETHVSVGDNQSNIPDVAIERELASEEYNNENECPDGVVSSVTKKSRQKSPPFRRKNVENVIDASPRMERSAEEKNIECVGEGVEKSKELFEPVGTLITLINALKGRFNEEETERILNELDVSLEKLSEDGMDDERQRSSRGGNYVRRLEKHFWNKKKLCEKLMREKTKLSEDLAVRDQLLLNLNSKEKEYLSIITNLKVSLEKTKAHAEDNIEILKELNTTKNKLLNETKVADALRKSHAKMQEQVHKCMLENDKLKTEIRLLKLESEKFCVLLAGKDAQIKHYKDEVESFQRQITDQLAALRSNNAANEVQKAMEAIIQQSQAFSVTDLDSAFSEGHSDEKVTPSKSRQRDRVMHSSPTSTKSSLSECSWNHISSIHESESKVDLDQTLEEVLVGDGEKKQACIEDVPSFASCKSANDTSALDPLANAENLGLSKESLRRNIKELFQDAKQVCSKRALSIPSDTVSFRDLFNSSGTSDMSKISASLFGKS